MSLLCEDVEKPVLRFEPNDLIVTIEGGLVQSVLSADDEITKRVNSVIIVDYDTEGALDSEVTLVKQPDGTMEEAYVRCDTIGTPGIVSVDTPDEPKDDTPERLNEVMERYPDLTYVGFQSVRPDKGWGAVTPEEFASRRQCLVDAVNQVKDARKWIKAYAVPRKTINSVSRFRSSSLKHVAERWGCTYISNGAFIAAMIMEGYRCRVIRDWSTSCVFNISLTKWKEARAQAKLEFETARQSLEYPREQIEHEYKRYA
jgi:hypothetical protein